MNDSSSITSGVEVSVQTQYSATHSKPHFGRYFFLYTISIKNKNNYSIQLLKRHWDIYDSTGEFNQLSGKGVVGVQPVIEPNQIYTYTSGCSFKSDAGKMSGFYTMLRLFDEKEFEIKIPEFVMILQAKLN
ncbi:MAG: Co2+/Mg2+ efflux protein ApaG [Bacteroidetes bacterium]|nr:Co2+/Mg2+ efflux protein ApaG [Bacteroidota bacterium]